jgi:hypothetical protein
MEQSYGVENESRATGSRLVIGISLIILYDITSTINWHNHVFEQFPMNLSASGVRRAAVELTTRNGQGERGLVRLCESQQACPLQSLIEEAEGKKASCQVSLRLNMQ